MTQSRTIIDTRQKTHGNYSEVACVSQTLKSFIRRSAIEAQKQEALEMICVKMARIACGDADFIDHWVDIAGYAQLVIDKIQKEQEEQAQQTLHEDCD